MLVRRSGRSRRSRRSEALKHVQEVGADSGRKDEVTRILVDADKVAGENAPNSPQCEIALVE